MNIVQIACVVLLFSTASCQRSSNPDPAIPQNNSESDSNDKGTTITIDGREAPPELEDALEKMALQWMGQAIAEGINARAMELNEKLEISGSIENDLLFMTDGPKWSGDDVLLSIYLFRPAEEANEPRTIVLSSEGNSQIRFTRASAPVEHPLAMMTATFTEEGRMKQTETFYIYRDRKWKSYHLTERHKTLN